MKLMVISHTFARKMLWKRWMLLAENYPDIDVTLIAPREWTDGNNSNYTFGTKMISYGEEYDSGNFHVRLVDMKFYGKIGWISKKLVSLIRKNKPDYIFHIGTHLQDSLYECIKVSRLFSRKTKVLVFSMRGPQHNLVKKKKSTFKQKLNHALLKHKLKVVRKKAAAIFCHYPDAKKLFLEEGFKQPIYIQTQVGVDTDVYCKNEEYRQLIRSKYNISDDCFVFASAVRMGADKGVPDIIESLPLEGNYKVMLMGSGNEQEMEIIKKAVEERGLAEKIIFTGFVNNEEMPKYWNAADCAIHIPRTTPQWVETFSLSVVQAMATELCVIGSSSGSVPYQIGPDGIIVQERDNKELTNRIIWAMNSPEQLKQIGIKMRERAEQCFSIKHLTKCLYIALTDIEKGNICEEHLDMTQIH